MTGLPVLFRAPRQTDFACVADNWLQSMRHAPGMGVMFDDVYWRVMKPLIEQRARKVHLLIATTEEDRDQVCGWVAFSPATSDPRAEDMRIGESGERPFRLHYVYVKGKLRHMGLAQQMIRHVRPGFGEAATVVTSACAPQAEWDRGERATAALVEPLRADVMLDALRWYAGAPQRRKERNVPTWRHLVQRWQLRYEPFG